MSQPPRRNKYDRDLYTRRCLGLLTRTSVQSKAPQWAKSLDSTSQSARSSRIGSMQSGGSTKRPLTWYLWVDILYVLSTVCYCRLCDYTSAQATVDWLSLVRVSDRRSEAASCEHTDAAIAFVDVTIRMLESFLSDGAPPVRGLFPTSTTTHLHARRIGWKHSPR